MKILLGALTAAVLLADLGVSDAAANTRGIDARQRRQREAIRQGVKSGDLTRRETRKLVSGQARTEAYERRAESDGRLTLRERRRLDHRLDVSRRHIFRERHDRQDRDR